MASVAATNSTYTESALSFLGIGVSQIGALWARHEVKAHHWQHIVNTALVSGTNLASFGLFWVLKLLVFNRIFHVGVVGQASKIKPVPMSEMTKRYASGALDPTFATRQAAE